MESELASALEWALASDYQPELVSESELASVWALATGFPPV